MEFDTTAGSSTTTSGRDPYGDYSEFQQIILSILPRAFSLFSVMSALWIIRTVSYHANLRSRIYHRLMMALALNVLALSALQLWGNLAVPKGTRNVQEARGTVATCTAQGFLYQVFGFAVPSYYCALSGLSVLAVLYDFRSTRYQHVEKYVHVVVYMFPLGSAFYLLAADAFNYSGFYCWIASEPLGCGTDDVLCTRGPSNIGSIQLVLAGIPALAFLVLPTLLMVLLYFFVRKNQNDLSIKASDVVRQSAMYLFTLYWSYVFSVVQQAYVMIADQSLFGLSVVAACVENGMGIWLLCAYVFLRQPNIPNVDDDDISSLGSLPEMSPRQHPSSPKPPIPDDISTVDTEIMRLHRAKERNESRFSLFDGTRKESCTKKPQWQDFLMPISM